MPTKYRINIKPSPTITAVVTLISIISLIGILSVGSGIQTRASNVGNSFVVEFIQQIFSGFVLGGVLALIVYRIGIDQILKFRRLLIIVSIVTLLYLALPTLIRVLTGSTIEAAVSYFKWLPVRPVVKNGAVRWLQFFFIQFQPVELVKIAVLVYFASYFQEVKDKAFTWDTYKRPLYIFALISLLISVQPDLGSIIIISLMVLTGLFLTKLNFSKLFWLLAIVMTFSSLAIAITPYRRDRFFNWVNNSQINNSRNLETINSDSNLQVKKIQQAVKNGNWFGVGYTKGSVKSVIPEVSSDGIFAVLVEEQGLVLAFVLIGLYLAIFVICIENGSKRGVGKYSTANQIIIIGIGSWIFYQALWNIGGVTGLFPLKGLPLPFVSEGGTSVAVNFIAVGLLCCCLKEVDKEKQI